LNLKPVLWIIDPTIHPMLVPLSRYLTGELNNYTNDAQSDGLILNKITAMLLTNRSQSICKLKLQQLLSYFRSLATCPSVLCEGDVRCACFFLHVFNLWKKKKKEKLSLSTEIPTIVHHELTQNLSISEGNQSPFLHSKRLIKAN